MLIADEVQSGFCRTGNWFAIEESGVTPDILVMAKVTLLHIFFFLAWRRIFFLFKGLGNGFPISSVVTRKGLTDSLPPGFIVCRFSIASCFRIRLTAQTGWYLRGQRSQLCGCSCSCGCHARGEHLVKRSRSVIIFLISF